MLRGLRNMLLSVPFKIRKISLCLRKQCILASGTGIGVTRSHHHDGQLDRTDDVDRVVFSLGSFEKSLTEAVVLQDSA
jgi:hypothetical protein